MNILFIDTTLKSPQQSRTHQLASTYLEAFTAKHGGTVTHLDLKALPLAPLTAQDTQQREMLAKTGDVTHKLTKYAHQFAQADHIVIAAPYWDLSFPSLLKLYIEYICVCGITFCYDEHGVVPLCQAKTLTYITTSGGEIYPDFNLGFDYLSKVSKSMFGIKNTQFLSAQNLDIFGADVDKIMTEAKSDAIILAKE